MRIRQVKPSFWTDPLIADLPAPVRLFYIGLWMVADDAGWFRWDTAQLGAELYGFEARARRERNVAAFGDQLEGAGRIVRHACGHAYIATLTSHQRLSGTAKQVLTFTREHERESAGPRTSPQVPAGSRTSPARYVKGTVRKGNGKERNGTRAREPEVLARRDEEDAIEAQLRAVGGKP